MKSILIIAAFAASLSAFAAPVSAQPARITVGTAGLDLNTPQGVRALDLRILHAASAVCGTPSPADGRGRAKYEDCRTEARTTAIAQRDQILQAANATRKIKLALTK